MKPQETGRLPLLLRIYETETSLKTDSVNVSAEAHPDNQENPEFDEQLTQRVCEDRGLLGGICEKVGSMPSGMRTSG